MVNLYGRAFFTKKGVEIVNKTGEEFYCHSLSAIQKELQIFNFVPNAHKVRKVVLTFELKE